MSLEANFSDAEAYEIQMGRWSRQLAEPFLDFVGIISNDYVLDVGCGTGSLAAAVLDRSKTCRVLGIDKSKAYVESARQQLGGRAEFRVGDACALPCGAGLFDKTLSLLVLHFVSQPEVSIQEMRRVTKPGGLTAAAVWDLRGGFVSQRIFYDTAAALFPTAVTARAQQFTRPMSRPGELEQAWYRAGFRNIDASSIAVRMQYQSFDDFWAPLMSGQGGAPAYVATLDDEARGKLRKALQLAYLDGEPDGPRSHAAVLTPD
jgi:ubiquinone/menaquinone biosynthesis C-methylase UbiE